MAAALDLRCRFGDHLSPTSFVDAGHVHCSAPPLRDYPYIARGRNALQPGEISFDFSRVPNASALAGSATIANGVLALTQAAPYQVGTFIIRPHMHLSAQQHFDARFELLMGGGTFNPADPAALDIVAGAAWEPLSGRGICFCFGNFTDEALLGLPFGEVGPEPTRGLVVRILTYTTRAIEV